MKKLFVILGLCSLVFAGCTKKDSGVASVADAVTNGTWRISNFSEGSNNETSDFSGFTFTFQANGKVQVAKSGIIKEGNWSESTTSQKLFIDLGIKSDANKLGGLSDDWVIVSKTATKINLTDDNSSSNELLEFTKKLIIRRCINNSYIRFTEYLCFFL